MQNKANGCDFLRAIRRFRVRKPKSCRRTRWYPLQKVFGAHARTLTFTAHRRNCRKEPAPDELIAPELLTVPQAAARLGVKPRTLWKWIYEHEIESVLLGRLRKVRIAAIDECIDRHTVKADNAQSRRVRKPARMRRDA